MGMNYVDGLPISALPASYQPGFMRGVDTAGQPYYFDPSLFKPEMWTNPLTGKTSNLKITAEQAAQKPFGPGQMPGNIGFGAFAASPEFYSDWLPYYYKYAAGTENDGDAFGGIGHGINNVVKSIGNNPVTATALPFIGALTPTGRNAIGNSLISGGAGFMTGGPIGALAGAGTSLARQSLSPGHDPITPRSALIDALTGAAAGKVPKLAGIRSGLSLARGPQAAQSSVPRQQNPSPMQAQQVQRSKILALLRMLPILGALNRNRNMIRATV